VRRPLDATRTVPEQNQVVGVLIEKDSKII